jgi:cytochrome c oxidase subunit II
MNRILINAFLIAACAVWQQTSAQPMGRGLRSDEQVIRISASTFDFKPSQIVVKKGVPVTLEFVTQDRHHGFKLAAFGLQADIQPGTVGKLRFVPDKVGTFVFLCDVFCGDGHEEMSGTLRVIEP